MTAWLPPSIRAILTLELPAALDKQISMSVDLACQCVPSQFFPIKKKATKSSLKNKMFSHPYRLALGEQAIAPFPMSHINHLFPLLQFAVSVSSATVSLIQHSHLLKYPMRQSISMAGGTALLFADLVHE